MGVYEKLLAIQSSLKAPKSQYNLFGKYRYRNCEDILEALKPLLKEAGAVVYISDELVFIGERYYIKAVVILTDIETKETITGTAYAREDEEKKGMDGSQVTGASSSYARKYALNGLFGIDDTKDSDTPSNFLQPQPEPEPVKQLSPAQLRRLFAIAKEAGFSDEGVKVRTLKKYGKEVKDLTRAEYDETCECIEKGKKEQQVK